MDLEINCPQLHKLITATTDWAKTSKVTQTFYFLIFKTFDKISHKFLLSKLHYYGIRIHTLNLMGAFLSNRTKMTVVNAVQYSYLEITSGNATMIYARTNAESILYIHIFT